MKLTVLFLICCSVLTAQSFAGESIEYGSAKEAYQGYWTKGKPNKPLIVLVHDWDGLTNYEEKRADMFAKLGYSVFALDMYGKGVRPTTLEDKKAITGSLYADRPTMRHRFDLALQWLKDKRTPDQALVVVGYCFGGTVTLEMAMSGLEANAFIPFHGGLAIPEGRDYSKTKGQVVVFHGSADKVVSMNDFAKLAESLEANKVMHEMITYGNAPHAFSVFGSDRYREKADLDSWARLTQILESISKP